jgi:U3 small nucleolar RNA-associated protein 22
MKRKRGPAPKGKKRKMQRREESEEEDTWDRIMAEKEAVEEEESEFEGLASDHEDVPESAMSAKDNTAAPFSSELQPKKLRGRKTAQTQEEIMDLFFRSMSFQSNLFKLQVDELLSEVRVKYDKMEKVERILHQLREILLKLPDTEEQLVSQCSD